MGDVKGEERERERGGRGRERGRGRESGERERGREIGRGKEGEGKRERTKEGERKGEKQEERSSFQKAGLETGNQAYCQGLEQLEQDREQTMVVLVLLKKDRFKEPFF